MERECVFYMEWTLWGGGGFKIQCGALSKGGGLLKKHKDMRGGLEKNTSTKEGVPRKKCKMVRFPPLPPWA